MSVEREIRMLLVRMLQVLLVAAMILLAALVAFGQTSEDHADVVGVYSLDGVNPDGEYYTGIVEVTRHDAFWHMRWISPSTQGTQGLGRWVTDEWMSLIYSTPGGSIGLMTLRLVREDGKPIVLIGVWMDARTEQMGRETLTQLDVERLQV